MRNAIRLTILGFVLLGVNDGFGYSAQTGTPLAGSAEAKSTKSDLVMVGTVTRIYPRPVTHSLKNWAVVLHVEKVKSGEFSGTTFTFTIHSPARSGLEVGRSYTVKATWKGAGYVVDETAVEPRRADSKAGFGESCWRALYQSRFSFRRPQVRALPA